MRRDRHERVEPRTPDLDWPEPGPASLEVERPERGAPDDSFEPILGADRVRAATLPCLLAVVPIGTYAGRPSRRCRASAQSPAANTPIPARSRATPSGSSTRRSTPNHAWVEEYEDAYRRGKVGDIAVKSRLVEVLNTLLEPIRSRRRVYEVRPDSVVDALRAGTGQGRRRRGGDARPGEEGAPPGLLPKITDIPLKRLRFLLPSARVRCSALRSPLT